LLSFTEEISEARRIKFEDIAKAAESPEFVFEDEIFIFFTQSGRSFLSLEISEIEFKIELFFGFMDNMEKFKD